MGKEIERKFLLANNKWKNQIIKETNIIQGYLNEDINKIVRIRIANEVGFLTIKGKNTGMIRVEFEYNIPLSDAYDLIKMCESPVIEKTRYVVVENTTTWEIDVFRGENEGLIIAEVELENENQSLTIPEWISKEVTLSDKYYNSSLRKFPYSKW